MKKLYTLIGLSLLLAGCGNVTTKVSNANEALFKVGSSTITYGELYTVMLASDPSGVVRSMALQIILDKEIEITPEMDTRADEELESFISNVGDSLDMYLSYYGFKDAEDYRRNGILVNLQQEVLVQRYVEENLTQLIEQNRPQKVRILEVVDGERAQAALTDIKSGADFEFVANQYGDGQYLGEELFVTTSTNLPFLIREYLNAQTAPTLSEVLPEGSTNYIVQVTVADPNKILDEIQTNFEQDSQFIELAIETAMKKYAFTIFDKAIYDRFITQFPNYLGQ